MMVPSELNSDAGVAVEDGNQICAMTCFDDGIVELGRGEFEPPCPVFLNLIEFFHERFRGALEGNSDANYCVGNCCQAGHGTVPIFPVDACRSIIL